MRDSCTVVTTLHDFVDLGLHVADHLLKREYRADVVIEMVRTFGVYRLAQELWACVSRKTSPKAHGSDQDHFTTCSALRQHHALEGRSWTLDTCPWDPAELRILLQVTLYLSALVCLRVISLAACLDRLRAEVWPYTKYDLVESVELRVVVKLRLHLRDIAARAARPLRPTCPGLDLGVCFMDVATFAADVGLVEQVRLQHQTGLMPDGVRLTIHRPTEPSGNAWEQHCLP